MIDIKVPTVGESISEVTIAQWLKKDGEWAERDEIICELESEKATFELTAEKAGTIKIIAQEGDTLNIGDLVCQIDDKAKKPASVEKASQATPAPVEAKAALKKETKTEATSTADFDKNKVSPVAKAIMIENKVDPKSVKGSGSQGRILKHDVLEILNAPGIKGGATSLSRNDRTEKMSNLRKTVSRRLVQVKNDTAMLTTFNEVDMTNIMAIRAKYKNIFKETHGVGLGFMSFFLKACSIALEQFPAVNAYIDNENLIYHDYCDISIAVSAPKGLVVPVIRNAESLNMAELEQAVLHLATKARENKLTIDEMTGGTFTITNGGVFGSMMSTPIINAPQSAILGMHKIEERPIALNGQVVIHPMMYVALSYDHRIIDGKESVGFLVKVKELLENPEYMLIGKNPVAALLGV